MSISAGKQKSGKSSYHHGDLRTALIDAALDIINELGPKRLTVREVAHRVGVSLRRMVVFKRLNLMRETYPFKGKFHLIFCRNVMNYSRIIN